MGVQFDAESRRFNTPESATEVDKGKLKEIKSYLYEKMQGDLSNLENVKAELLTKKIQLSEDLRQQFQSFLGEGAAGMSDAQLLAAGFEQHANTNYMEFTEGKPQSFMDDLEMDMPVTDSPDYDRDKLQEIIAQEKTKAASFMNEEVQNKSFMDEEEQKASPQEMKAYTEDDLGINEASDDMNKAQVMKVPTKEEFEQYKVAKARKEMKKAKIAMKAYSEEDL